MTLYFKTREEWIASNPLLIRTVRLRRAVEKGIAGLSAILAKLIANEAEIRGHYGTGDWFPKRELYIAATRSRKTSGKTEQKRQDAAAPDASLSPPCQ